MILPSAISSSDPSGLAVAFPTIVTVPELSANRFVVTTTVAFAFVVTSPIAISILFPVTDTFAFAVIVTVPVSSLICCFCNNRYIT